MNPNRMPFISISGMELGIALVHTHLKLPISLHAQTPIQHFTTIPQFLEHSLALSVSDCVQSSSSTEPIQYAVSLVSKYRHSVGQQRTIGFVPANYF